MDQNLPDKKVMQSPPLHVTGVGAVARYMHCNLFTPLVVCSQRRSGNETRGGLGTRLGKVWERG